MNGVFFMLENLMLRRKGLRDRRRVKLGWGHDRVWLAGQRQRRCELDNTIGEILVAIDLNRSTALKFVQVCHKATGVFNAGKYTVDNEISVVERVVPITINLGFQVGHFITNLDKEMSPID